MKNVLDFTVVFKSYLYYKKLCLFEYTYLFLHQTCIFIYDSKMDVTYWLKVCHLSAFQTISRRSVYIKIIKYSDSISANLNNTIQTKQHDMKKPHSYSNRNKIYKGLYFVVEGFWSELVPTPFCRKIMQ